VDAARLAPTRYGSKDTSGLKVKITPGVNVFNIEMKSR